MPRTKPETRRPSVRWSSIAISSATRSGWSRMPIALPRTMTLRAARAPRQRRGHDVGRGHQPVGRLVVLVDRDAVEAELLGVLELVEVAVVELVAELGVEVLVGEVQRRRGVALVEVVGQVRVRHEVEEDELHARAPPRRNVGDDVGERLGALEVHGVAAVLDDLQRARRGSARRTGARARSGMTRSSSAHSTSVGAAMRLQAALELRVVEVRAPSRSAPGRPGRGRWRG